MVTPLVTLGLRRAETSIFQYFRVGMVVQVPSSAFIKCKESFEMKDSLFFVFNDFKYLFVIPSHSPFKMQDQKM